MEEEDTCRICRSGPEEDMPLYHPCKCSGSIAQVHQDCLIDWLQHSKKKSCELCNTQLRFHKVYSPSMPEKLPAYLYIRRFFIQSLLALRFFLRSIIVGLSWCALLPLLNLGVWRLHFMVVDHMVWGLIGGAPPSSRFTTSLVSNITVNATQPISSSIVPISAQTSIVVPSEAANMSTSDSVPGLLLRQFIKDRITIPLFNTSANATYDTLDHIAQDTFEGQMLTCAIILFFVAIFLLREWCLQNLPQPVDGIVFAAAPVAAEVPQAPAAVVPQAILPELAIPAGLDWQVPENEQAGANHIDYTRLNQDRALSPKLRPRLRHGVPDPPELQVQASSSSLLHDIEPLSMEEMRRKRAERFDRNVESSEGPTKGKAKQEEEDLFVDGKGKTRMLDVEEYEAKGGEDSDDEIWENFTEPLGESYEEAQQEVVSSIDSLIKSDAGDTSLSESSAAAQTTANESERNEEDLLVEERAVEVRAVPAGPVIDAHGWEDDVDNGDRLEDDMEGILEAVGLQGPLINLFTNMLMMFVLCSFVLVIAIALPYLIGRVFGVGTNFIKFVNLPVRGLRFFTDPLVDYVVLKSANGIDRMMHTAWVNKIVGARMAKSTASIVRTTKESTWYHQASLQVSSYLSAVFTTEKEQKATSNTIVAIASKETPHAKEVLKASIIALCSNLQTSYFDLSANLHKWYIDAEVKTQGVNQDDKMFCVLLGHLYWLIGLFIQKQLSSVYLRWNLKWLKTTVDQQLVVFKVLAFIVLELAIFPWCCGVLLDLSLLPLWQDVTISSRIALIQSKPLSVGFTQWSLGTLYMFALAQFVSNTRSIVRPGVLCFVRDAGDPGFHPIKDILERKTGEQLRKIGVSGLIYSGILAGTIGFCSNVIYLMDWQSYIFPLRWEMHQSLTTTGFEYVFISLVLAPLFKAWLPTLYLKKAVKVWWKFMARQLRISSYLIGGSFEEERGHYIAKNWKDALTRKFDQATFIKDGEFGRVPADDHAVMSSPIVIRTDESGEPTTERGFEAMQKQQEAIDKLTKKPQYTIVYLPPHFRARIITLLIALWASISTCFVVILLVPLLTGRIIIDSIYVPTSHPPLHDGYSWLLGIIMIGSTAQLIHAARRLTSSNRPSRRFTKMLKRFGEYIWMFTFTSLTGTLLGICVELYINALSRPFISAKEGFLPDISVLHTWCTGTLLQFTVVQVLEFKRGTATPLDWDTIPLTGASVFNAIIELRNSNLRKPKIWRLTKRGFLPSIIIFLYAIIAPFVLLWGIQLAFGKSPTREGQSLQLYLAFMICLKSLWFGLFMKAISRVADRWTGLIRDEVFLVSTQLKNYSSEDHKKSAVNGNNTHAADGPLPDALLHR